MNSAILQVIIYSVIIFYGALFLRPNYESDKPKIQYLGNKKIDRERKAWE